MDNQLDRTIERLQAFRDVSEQLREALMTRRSDEILVLVNEQESLARDIRGILDAQPAAPKQGENGPAAESRRMVHDLVSGIRRIQRTNHAIASTLCDTIDRTLRRFCSGPEDRTGTYGANGFLNSRAAPMLVHQKG